MRGATGAGGGRARAFAHLPCRSLPPPPLPLVLAPQRLCLLLGHACRRRIKGGGGGGDTSLMCGSKHETRSHCFCRLRRGGRRDLHFFLVRESNTPPPPSLSLNTHYNPIHLHITQKCTPLLPLQTKMITPWLLADSPTHLSSAAAMEAPIWGGWVKLDSTGVLSGFVGMK